MDDTDETVAWARAHGPAPLLLDGWDHSSTWGWDEASGSLYAHLLRNSDDPATKLALRIGPDGFTPAITFATTLAQHIAMAVDCSPWDVITALDEIIDQDDDTHCGTEVDEAGTVVTMAEGHDTWWPQ